MVAVVAGVVADVVAGVVAGVVAVVAVVAADAAVVDIILEGMAYTCTLDWLSWGNQTDHIAYKIAVVAVA